ncbi:MAG: hypothetical protein ACUVUC_08860 [Thermoguttaceae bacterium]
MTRAAYVAATLSVVTLACLGAVGLLMSGPAANQRPATLHTAASHGLGSRTAGPGLVGGAPEGDDAGLLRPVPEDRGEPTPAPADPGEGTQPGSLVLVPVEVQQGPEQGGLPAFPAIPEWQGEPTPAPPEPVSPMGAHYVILVHVEAEQTGPERVGTR